MQREFPFMYKIRDPQILKNQSFRQHRLKRLSRKLLNSKKVKIFSKRLTNFNLIKYLNFKNKISNKKIITLSAMKKPLSNTK